MSFPVGFESATLSGFKEKEKSPRIVCLAHSLFMDLGTGLATTHQLI